ncbi:hypothetical protein ACFO1B_17815 [Dactylosporangium siamense]|uniref:Uncharacterized protein n=1 Tax=Dactylosporangium siamense TaxID=685454 RepID=A0A919U8G7_9ACTN|nr:hypothetical protein [Dactylosporangium siamense]GIG45702.1 hypothetical protein Dsi01nite_037430 [Dactylosporangium siamense]
MKRKTLDILFGLGGVVLAGLLLIAGIVLTSNADFANDYVRSQLAQQQISFKPAATMTAEEQRSACLVRYAGQQLTTGKQAECYANEFIGLHLKSIAGGKTYAQLGDVQTDLRAKIAALPKDDPAVAGLQQQLTDATTARETVFKGETLRGLLLTSYGFSEFGAKAGQAALVAYLAAGLLLLLGAAGLVHAAITPATRGFAVPETTGLVTA